MELKPEIGKWYKAYCTSKEPIYIIRLDRINEDKSFSSNKWKSINKKDSNYESAAGGFDELIEEIPCPLEFQQIFIPLIFN